MAEYKQAYLQMLHSTGLMFDLCKKHLSSESAVLYEKIKTAASCSEDMIADFEEHGEVSENAYKAACEYFEQVLTEIVASVDVVSEEGDREIMSDTVKIAEYTLHSVQNHLATGSSIPRVTLEEILNDDKQTNEVMK